jgi:adenylate kinase family enzyme
VFQVSPARHSKHAVTQPISTSLPRNISLLACACKWTQIIFRLVIIGCSGSGKSTLAAALSDALQIKHVELDALHWGNDWQTLPVDAFKARVQRVTALDNWIVDGNYSVARDALWPLATHVVWIDLSLLRTLVRVTRRSLHRISHREALWGTNNVETVRRAFFSKDSIIVWALQSHHRRRVDSPPLLEAAAARGVTVYRLRTPSEVQIWSQHIIATLTQKGDER